MVPMVSIVGKSGAGKTFLLEKLIPQLKEKGYRVAAAKHSHHKFDFDLEGKDSWRLFQAGAEAVLLFSPENLAYIARPKEITAGELPRFFPDGFDILLVEGFRGGGLTKIEVARNGELLCSPEELWAVVSDQKLNLPHWVNQFSWQEIPQLAGLIEGTFLSSPSSRLELYVNNRPVLLKPFVQEIISRTVLGMISSLKEVSEIKRLELRIWET